MDPGWRRGCRDVELATGFVRTSSAVSRIVPILRKCSALINRSEAVGVIVQRIIGSDPRILHGLNWILNGLPHDTEANSKLTLPDAIEMMGWPMVREIALVVLLHEIHCETAPRLRVRADLLTKRAVAMLAVASELGANPVAALFANIGELPIAINDLNAGTLKRESIVTMEDLLRAEQGVVGFDHAALSAVLIREVDFPTDICEEVLCHPTVGCTLWIAEQLVKDLGYDGLFDHGIRVPDLWPKLKLSKLREERFRASVIGAAELPSLAFIDTFADVA